MLKPSPAMSCGVPSRSVSFPLCVTMFPWAANSRVQDTIAGTACKPRALIAHSTRLAFVSGGSVSVRDREASSREQARSHGKTRSRFAARSTRLTFASGGSVPVTTRVSALQGHQAVAADRDDIVRGHVVELVGQSIAGGIVAESAITGR